ncbi:nuclear receptor corepressor 1 [Phtheirospermum japonicum]|uniref:Nuclear receptor corepressor 1 n=1 Tax=Phtheirospermum japonicum TaxID=374723 RepID=A0A830B5C7_9LAMI|nr:nuclear receptor corepressor 1 [Phtheirospermum japonicum]
MPPEQLPWDRRDFRKHDRSGPDARFAGGGGGFGGAGQHRWREQNRHPHAPSPHPQPYRHHHNQPMKQRWYSEFRSARPIPPGRGKQGGWHMYPEEAGHGFPPFGSRYGDRNLEDDNFRPFRSHGDGSPGRPNTEVNNQKSVENTQTCLNNSSKGNNSEDTQTCYNNNSKGNNSEDTETCHNNSIKGNDYPHPLPDSPPDQSQSVVKEKNEKDGGTADEIASSAQKPEKEKVVGSMDWKLKWNRSGSMSSRGSGFSRTSSSKSMGVDSIEKVAEVQQKNAMPVNSPLVVCVEPTAAPAPSEDTGSRKKPRLGWGEGLAKYEKKKVPEDFATKDGMVCSVSTTETMQSPSANLLDRSPKVAHVLEFASPVTPSLVACSSSPGIDEKESVKAVNIDHDAANLSCSPILMSRTHCEGPTFNLENLDLTSIANLSSLINEMLQSDDPSSVETGYVRTTSMNKLLVWKVDMLKALEVTESEIDMLETELKSLSPHPAAFSLLPGECHSKPCEQVTASSTVRPAPLQLVAPGDMIVENMPAVNEDEHETLKDDDIDSPGSATSKLTESLHSGEGAFNSETPECVERFVNLGSNNSSNLGSSEDGLTDEDKICLVDDFQDLDSVGDMHFDVEHVYHSILASNKESATSALEELNKLLPDQQRHFDMLAACNVSSLQRDSSVIKERFLMRKRSLLFKEKVLTLKFKVFQHFWREGRIISVSKLRGKSHKKLDLCRTGYKKNRSSSRSRISYSAGSSRKVPAEEVIEYVNGLLTESPLKPCRSTLKMPALILDKGIKMSRFVSNNALVEDPCVSEKERSMINPWTADETEIFIDKLAIFGKDFSKIASFLDHKTIADCIEFYYKNHKSECFQRAKLGVNKQIKPQSTAYLVANGKRWNCEANAASLDILGEASAIVANVNDGLETQQKCTPRIFLGASSSQKAPRGDHGPLERSNSLDNEAVAADVLAGICGSLSSEAMSSCITSSVDPADGYQDWKCQRVTCCVKRPLTPDGTQNFDDECSDESCGEMDPADWTDEEKSFFVQAVSSYGKDFAMISQCLRTKSIEQCKIFFSKARKCLGLDRILPVAVNAAVSGDGNGGGSDTEDACVVQTDPVICNDDSECKMEEDLPPDESDIAGMSDSKLDLKICGEDNNRPPCSPDPIAAEPVSMALSMDDTVVEDDKQAVDFNMDSKEESSANGASTPELDVKSSVVSADAEPVRDDGDDGGKPNVSCDADNKGLVKVSDGHHQEDNEGQGVILPEDDLEKRKIEDGVANSVEMAVDGQLTGDVSHPSVDYQKESGCQKLSLQQNGHLSSVESSMLFSVPIKYQRHPSTDVLSEIGANVISEKQPQKVARTGDCQQRRSGFSLSGSVEPSQILKGYPVSVQTVKEMNGDFSCVKHVPLQNVSNRDLKLSSDRNAEFSLRKCTTGLRNRNENVPFPSQSGCSPDVDKPPPSRNGDVKLFGKILISSQEKTSSCDRDDNNIIKNNGQHHKAGHHHQPLNLKFSGGDQKVNLDSFSSKVDFNNYLSSENNNIPFKSFGGWDENRTQAAIFPQLPDSTLLLAKYPAAFSTNHSAPTVKLDQAPLNGIVLSNDHHPFNGVSVFPSSGNGMADYQLLRSRELQQSFTVDMKQTQEMLFTEMQRRNGFSVVPGLQQQARSMVGIDVGRGGVLAGGQCSGVSDPVTAIKMHYANAQSVSVQSGNIIREDDMWRGNGDVGR